MIQAQDLRIGNWLNVNKDGQLVPHQLTCIGYNMDGYEGYSAHFKGCSCTLEDHFDDGELDVQGIPLTEEWLLKFGFERMPTNSEYDYKLDDFHLNVDPDLENGYWVDGLGLMKSIQYVHQLQNLYKALSNEELTIKQP